MRAKLDENLPVESIPILESAGWQCETVFQEGLSGAEDERVSEICRTETRVLFTIDLDFADIRAYPPSEYEGIVVLRPIHPSRERILRLLERTMPLLGGQWVAHRLWIVEPGRIRFRGAEAPSD